MLPASVNASKWLCSPRVKSRSDQNARHDQKRCLSHPAPQLRSKQVTLSLSTSCFVEKRSWRETGSLADTASDHAVAIQPVSSPLSLTPDHVPSTPDSGLLQEQEHFLSKRVPSTRKASRNQCRLACSGLLESLTTPDARRRSSLTRAPCGLISKVASLLLSSAQICGQPRSELEWLWRCARDAQPRPPREVLRRPEPYAMQGHGSEDTSTPMSERFGSETSIITLEACSRRIACSSRSPGLRTRIFQRLDELQARKYTIRDEDWHEYVVVFRIGKLELWADPRDKQAHRARRPTQITTHDPFVAGLPSSRSSPRSIESSVSPSSRGDISRLITTREAFTYAGKVRTSFSSTAEPARQRLTGCGSSGGSSAVSFPSRSRYMSLPLVSKSRFPFRRACCRATGRCDHASESAQLREGRPSCTELHWTDPGRRGRLQAHQSQQCDCHDLEPLPSYRPMAGSHGRIAEARPQTRACMEARQRARLGHQ